MFTRHIYSLLFYLILPAVWFRVWWRSWKEPEYRHDPLQRFGIVTRPSPTDSLVNSKQPVLWVHAVSAGETIAAVPLIKRLLQGGYRIVVTNMTPAGRARTRALLGNQVENYYVPYDLPGSVKRFVGNLQPQVLIVVDTELWPNMLHYSRVTGVRTVLANARLSEKSARGYSRIKAVSEEMMRNVTCVAAQTQAHGRRFVDMGLDESKLNVTGSIKFDNSLPVDFKVRTAAAKQVLGPGMILLAASTHAGEEKAILAVFGELRQSRDDLRLVLAPRHTHRADEVAVLCEDAGYPVIRRTTGKSCRNQDPVFLLDTMGELAGFYGAADVAFVGGSLVSVGGHNFIEAVMAGTPVVMGPHLHNVDDLAAQFTAAEAMVVVHDQQELLAALQKNLDSTISRQELATNALEVLSHNQGALDRVEQLVLEQVENPVHH